MNEDQIKQLLGELKLIRIGALVIAAFVVLDTLNRVFRIF